MTYDAAEHDAFPRGLDLSGSWTLDSLSRRLDRLEDYRRWAFESAALDLALRQAGRSLGEALGREHRPVRFVVSTRHDPHEWLAVDPGLEFKLDPTSEWDDERIARYAETASIRVLDLKGHYRGTPVDQPPDAELYLRVARAWRHTIIEDPFLNDGTSEALRGLEEWFSFDAPIHSVADIEALPLGPRFLNVKPSRFGSLARLCECLDFCERGGISMYGGGQFELGVGRRHIQVLASLFYPDGPNDVAPGEYNVGEPRPGLPRSPLAVAQRAGF